MKNRQNARFRFKKLYGKDTSLPFCINSPAPVPRPADANLQSWMLFYLGKEVIGIESPHTVRAKAYDLHKLLAFYEHTKRDQSSIASWDKAFTSTFVDALEKEYATGTVHRIFATVTNFVQFLIIHEVILPINNPTTGIRLQDQELPPPQGIQAINKEQPAEQQMAGEEIYASLLTAARELINDKSQSKKPDRALPHRDLAIISLLYNTGLRVDEACSITIAQLEQLSSGDMWIRNVKCKGKKVRKAYVKPASTELLLNYIEKERGWAPGFVFQSWRGQKLNQPDIWRILNKIAKKAQQSLPSGTVINIHPHSLRHERGYNLRKAGLGDAMIAEQLGHRGTGQVARYSRRSEQDEAEILRKI